jgi:hypothetical protein
LAHSIADSIEISQVRDRECDIIWHQQYLMGETSNQPIKQALFVVRTMAGPLIMTARERTETWLNDWTLLTSSAMLCFEDCNLFCVLLMAWKEWWQIESIQFLFCHTHCLLSCNGGNSCMVLLIDRGLSCFKEWNWQHVVT